MSALWPPCEFDDCGSPGPVDAVAVVPLVSPGVSTPWAWVLSCAGCVTSWQATFPAQTPIELGAPVVPGRSEP